MAAAPPPPAPRGAPLMAPARPAAFVARPAELQRLRHHLRAGPPGRPLALTTAWPGASGGGKTTLAAALGHDPEVRRAFPAGILWVTLGPAPNLLAVLTDLVAALIGERPFFGDADAAAAQLDRLVAARRCLLVLDDVWAIGHLTAFPLLRDPRALVITTHFPDLAAAARAEAVVVDAMTGPQASALLAQAHAPSADLAPLAVLAARLGAWPILLDLARGALQALLARSAPWPAALAQVDAALDAAGVPPVAPPTGADPHPALHGLLDLSLHLLDGAARDHCRALAILPADTCVPLPAVARLWGLPRTAAEALVGQLAALALLQPDPPTDSIRLHELVRAHLAAQVADRAALQARLVNAWDDLYALPSGPDVGEHLGPALVQAGRGAELRALLFDPRWLLTRLHQAGSAALLADFDALPADDTVARQVQGALRLAAPILTATPPQLASQLWGRLDLAAAPEIATLLEAARSLAPGPWLRSIVPRLTSPRAPPARRPGHSRTVLALAVTHDGRYAVAASSDRVLRVWDLATGAELRTITGAAAWAQAVAAIPGGRHAVSGGPDSALHIWDLTDGALVRTLAGPLFQGVEALALTPDGERAVIAAGDHLLWVLDLRSGTVLGTFAGHTDSLTAVVVTPDGRRALSASWEQDVRVWDLGSGAPLPALEGHSGPLGSLAISPDGRRAFAGAWDQILVWDLAQGAVLRPLAGPGEGIHALVVTPDSRHIVAGGGDRTLRIYDLASGALVATFAGDAPFWSCAVAPDGLIIVAGDERGRVHFLRLENA